MIKGFIFDLDGVLVDTVDYHYASWEKLARQLGFKLQPTIKEKLKGISRMDSLELVLNQYFNIPLLRIFMTQMWLF